MLFHRLYNLPTHLYLTTHHNEMAELCVCCEQQSFQIDGLKPQPNTARVEGVSLHTACVASVCREHLACIQDNDKVSLTIAQNFGNRWALAGRQLKAVFTGILCRSRTGPALLMYQRWLDKWVQITNLKSSRVNNSINTLLSISFQTFLKLRQKKINL